MTTTLPVPIELRLPGPEWQPVAPESMGVVNAAFLAVREAADDSGYRPTIVVSGGLREDGAELASIGEESLALLREQGAQHVELLRRTPGGAAAPSLTQLMGAVVTVEGRRYDLRQIQVISSMPDVDDPTLRAVVLFTFTCTVAQLDVIGPEFQRFVASVRPVDRSGEGPDSATPPA
ncbi:MAG: hypothetical protein R2731_10030 [Nocardioides sp.]